MFIFYIDGRKLVSDNYEDILWGFISSPDENTPAFEDLTTNEKLWCEKGFIMHRLDGPARLWSDETMLFYINDKCYFSNIHDWLKIIQIKIIPLK
jgi:hypothetical protein